MAFPSPNIYYPKELRFQKAKDAIDLFKYYEHLLVSNLNLQFQLRLYYLN